MIFIYIYQRELDLQACRYTIPEIQNDTRISRDCGKSGALRECLLAPERQQWRRIPRLNPPVREFQIRKGGEDRRRHRRIAEVEGNRLEAARQLGWTEIVVKRDATLATHDGQATRKDGCKKGPQHTPGGDADAAGKNGIPRSTLQRAKAAASLSDEAHGVADRVSNARRPGVGGEDGDAPGDNSNVSFAGHCGRSDIRSYCACRDLMGRQ
ncbi:MAG TPA: hypothetical protein VGC40_02155 [Paenirhodobacter sp.]